MGKSTSIKSMEKNNQEFKKYLIQLKVDAQKDLDIENKKMDETIAQFYKANKDDGAKSLSAGQFYDVLHSAEWSLDNLGLTISAIGNAIFNVGSKPPDGATINKETVSSALTSMANLEVYLASKCFEVISSIMSSTRTSIVVESKCHHEHKPLGNGLHLFVNVTNDSYQEEDYFNNETIYQYIICYSIYYSHKEAEAQGEMLESELYLEQLESYRTLIEKKAREMAKMTDDAKIDAAQETLDKWDKQVEKLEEKLHKLPTRKG